MGGAHTVVVPRFTRNGLEGWVERRPPFDCLLGMCDVDGCPGGDLGLKSHGRGSAQYFWMLRGEGVAVRWSWFADEHLPETITELDPKFTAWRDGYPLGGALTYHTATPAYDNQQQSGLCDLLGIPCYADVCHMTASDGIDVLTAHGDGAAWDWLEAQWREWAALV